MKEERTIAIYERNDSIYLGDAIKTINIDHIPFEELENIILANEGDPFLYDGYILETDAINKLNAFLKEKIIPDFELYEYALECYGT